MDKETREKIEKKLSGNRAVLGLQRKAHFEAGGDLASWRGRPNVHIDQKKQKNKNACRKSNRREW